MRFKRRRPFIETCKKKISRNFNIVLGNLRSLITRHSSFSKIGNSYCQTRLLKVLEMAITSGNYKLFNNTYILTSFIVLQN